MSVRKIIEQQAWIQQLKKSTAACAAIRMAHADLPRHIRREIRTAAAVGRVPLFDAIASNFAYEVALIGCSPQTPTMTDFCKSLVTADATPVGCTTFALIEAEDIGGLINTKVHFGRNLDWPDPGGELRKATVTKTMESPHRRRFESAQIPNTFQSVTFPGYSGVLTACAPMRFAVALNAVMTEEPGRYGKAPTHLLRRVMDECLTFEEAVHVLSRTPLMTSAAFTVVSANHFGTPEHAVVIERSPTKYAIRYPEQIEENKWLLAVTNDTRIMKCDGVSANIPGLSETTCKRYDGVCDGARLGQPVEDILRDAEFGCTIYRVHTDILGDDPHFDAR